MLRLVRFVIPMIAMLVFVTGCESPTERTTRFVASGQKLLVEGDYALADVQFRNALQINQNLVTAWYGLSQVAEKQADWEKTYGLLNKVVALDPEHVPAHVTLGKINLAAGQLDKGLEHSDIALKLAPESADVRALRATVLYRLTDADGAVREARLALETDPGNVDALVVLASERLAAGDAAAAVDYMDRGLEQNERNVALQLIKVKALDQLQDFEQVVGVYNRLIVFYPGERAFRHALARLYINNEKLDEAETVYRTTVDENPADIEAKLDLVRYLVEFRGTAPAEQQLLVYIEASPAIYQLRFGLAELYATSEEPKKSRAVYEAIIGKDGNGPNGLLAKNQLALMAIEAGDQDAANSLIEEVLAVEVRNPQALIMRANQALEERKAEDAIADLRTVLRDEPDSAVALALLAKAHLQAGSLGLAKDYYIKAVRAHPGNPSIVLEYARLLIKTGEIDQAEEILQTLLGSVPNNLNALQLMAQVKISQQEWAAAQVLADRIRAAGGEAAVSDQIRGAAFQGQQLYDKSIEAFKRVHQASPTAMQPLVALVRTYVRAGKLAEAEQFLQAVLNAHEENIYAYVLLGRLYVMNEKPEAAEQAFRSAVETNPDKALGYRNMAVLYAQEDRLDEAKAVLRQGLAQIPGELTLHLTLGGTYEEAFEYEQAIAVYEGILEENPNVDVAANNLASLLIDHRDDQASLDRAYELAERFRKSKIGYFQDTLGWVYYRMGRMDEAVPLLEDAVESMPAFPAFRYHLGMSYLAEEQKEKAKVELEKAVSLSGKDSPEAENARKVLEGL